MLEKPFFAIAVALAGVVLTSSPGWAAQPLTPTQARDIAKFKTVSLLLAVPDKPRIVALDGVCANVEAIDGWDFKNVIEKHLTEELANRFTFVPKTYDADALMKFTFGQQIPRDALPPSDDVDAFVIIWGSVVLHHPSGMSSKSPAYQAGALRYLMDNVYTPALNAHDPELEYAGLFIEIINAKTKKTIARKEVQTGPYDSLIGPHLLVSGPGSKEREEEDWLCGRSLTDEQIQDVRDEFQMLAKGTLDASLQILRLTPTQQKK